MAETLQQLADRGIQVYNGQQYSNTSGNSYTPVGSGDKPADPLRREITAMTLDDAKREADKAFSGIVAPMTTEQIRNREAEAKKLTKETADAVYNPTISREKQVGGAQVSTAEGVVGQRQGFNISTAEVAFVADVQNKVLDRVREVENIKANYISQGNMAAAQRADDQLQKLNEWNTEMTIAKAEYALKVMSGAREDARLGIEQARLGLEEKAQAFNQTMAEKNLGIAIAGLTGEYEGSPTFAATQAKIENAFAIADITGYYNGKKTLEAVTTEAQLALQKEGVEIDRLQLQETIRSNKAQEGLAAARLSGEKNTTKTPSQIADESIKRLVDLRNSGKLNDANYRMELSVMADVMGYDITDPNQYEAVRSVVNKSMEGDRSATDWMNAQINQSMGSDFIISDNRDAIVNDFNRLTAKYAVNGKVDNTAKSLAREELIKSRKYSSTDVYSATGNILNKIESAIGLR